MFFKKGIVLTPDSKRNKLVKGLNDKMASSQKERFLIETKLLLAKSCWDSSLGKSSGLNWHY